MYKIEQLLNDAVATFTTADGESSTVFVGQLLDGAAIATLKVENGSVVYSINEGELVEVHASGAAPVAPVDEPAKATK